MYGRPGCATLSFIISETILVSEMMCLVRNVLFLLEYISENCFCLGRRKQDTTTNIVMSSRKVPNAFFHFQACLILLDGF